MKKFLLVCTLVMVLLCLPAFAEDEAVINDTSYAVANDGNFEISFSVETENVNALAVVSAYDEDGRLVNVKFAQITSSAPISKKLGNYKDIKFARIVVFEDASTLSPLCTLETVQNFTVSGDTDIPVGSLFPVA